LKRFPVHSKCASDLGDRAEGWKVDLLELENVAEPESGDVCLTKFKLNILESAGGQCITPNSLCLYFPAY
jgi:hypothetical protein